MVTSPDQTNAFRLLLLETRPESLEVARTVWTHADIIVRGLEQEQCVADLVSREKVQMVICELACERASGQKAVQQIRRVHPHLPIVAVLSEQEAPLAIEAFRNGANDVLIHPLSSKSLLDAQERVSSQMKVDAELVNNQQAAKRSLEDLILLKAIGETTCSTEEQGALLDRIVKLIQAALDVDIVSLMLGDDNGFLKIRAACGLPAEMRDKVAIAPGEGVSGHVMETGEPVLIDDLSTDGRFAQRDDVTRYRSGALLSVPIRHKQQVKGVLNVNNKRNGEAFSAADQELLLMIARQTALAIENMKLIGHLQAKNLEVERAHADLIKLHQDRTRFVCNLSHELKTPLTSVLGYSDLLINFYNQIDDSQLLEYINGIYSEGKHLESLLTGMLRLFSLDSGSEDWAWQSLSLQDAVARVLLGYEEKIADKDLDVQLSMPEEVLPVWCDIEKLDLLLDSLIDNAVKFNKHGGRLSISAGALTLLERPMTYLQIANQGKTVSRENAEDIFQEYSQLGALDSGKPSGIGVGLATCRAILRQMHGDIFLEPVDGEGTMIGLLLPTEERMIGVEND